MMPRCNRFMVAPWAADAPPRPDAWDAKAAFASPNALTARASFSSSASTATGGAVSSRESSPAGSPRLAAPQPPGLAVTAPGDILCVVANEGLADVGAVGGLMGHVLLVASEPFVVQPGSQEAENVEAEWGHRRLWPLVRMSIMESTREAEGLSETELYCHVDEQLGQVRLVGEYSEAGGYVEYNDDVVEVWRPPAALREGFRHDLMAEVLSEMRKNTSSWSYATAARAVLRSARVAPERAPSTADAPRILRDLRGCWVQEPICTSVVIGFWQRYLCALAGAGPSAYACTRPQEALTAVHLILQYMPLMADRALPTELRTVLRLKCGWQATLRPSHKPLRGSFHIRAI